MFPECLVILHTPPELSMKLFTVSLNEFKNKTLEDFHHDIYYFGRFHCIKNFAGVIWKKGRQWIRRHYDRFWLLWSYENVVIFFVNILNVRGHSFMTLTKRGRRGSILRIVAGGFLGKRGWGSFLTLMHIYMYNKQIYFYSSQINDHLIDCAIQINYYLLI